MADISLSRTHSFDSETGKAKLEKLVGKFQTAYGSMIERIDWNADRSGATAEGKMFSGNFGLVGNALKVELELKGFAAKMAKGMIQQKLEKAVAEEFPA
jgi:putative polyhydroxyalkanoate system protein